MSEAFPTCLLIPGWLVVARNGALKSLLEASNTWLGLGDYGAHCRVIWLQCSLGIPLCPCFYWLVLCPREGFIHSFMGYVLGVCPMHWGITANKTDKSSCPDGVHGLVEETGHQYTVGPWTTWGLRVPTPVWSKICI